MLFLACGPSLHGKTHLVREWLLPTLLTDPLQLSDAAPREFKMALIHDPRSRKSPNGQYVQAASSRFLDVAEWRRASRKPRVAAFDRANTRELFRVAQAEGDTILVIDEIDLQIPSAYPLSDEEKDVVNRGRHNGIALVGTMRRLHGVRPELRANLQVVYLGGLSEPDDRNYAAKTACVPESMLHGLEARTFLEYRKETGAKCLMKVVNGRRIVLQTL